MKGEIFPCGIIRRDNNRKITRRNDKKRFVKTAYLGSGVIGEPYGGEMTPPELPLGDVAPAGELIADPDRMVSTLAVGVDALVLLRSRRRRVRHIPPLPRSSHLDRCLAISEGSQISRELRRRQRKTRERRREEGGGGTRMADLRRRWEAMATTGRPNAKEWVTDDLFYQ